MSETEAEPTMSPQAKREKCRADVMMLVAHAAGIDVDEVRAMVRELERYDAFGCMIDPTQWIQTANLRKLNTKIARAVLEFRAALEAKS